MCICAHMCSVLPACVYVHMRVYHGEQKKALCSLETGVTDVHETPCVFCELNLGLS